MRNLRQWAALVAIFLFAPWVGTMLWMQLRGGVPQGRDADKLLEAVYLENSTEGGMTEADGKDAAGTGAANETDSAGDAVLLPRTIIISRGEETVYRRLEDFLPGVVARQMPDRSDGEIYRPEVWKCQAVIARTYICGLMQGRGEIHEEELDLDYLGDEKALTESERNFAIKKLGMAEEAVHATTGIVMKYEGNYILPMFHEISAGRTRAGGEDFPYLQPVECGKDTGRDDFLSTYTFSRQEFAARVSRADDALPVSAAELPSQIQTVKKDSSGYMEELKIGASSYTGDEIRYSLGLPSPHFSIEADGDAIKIIVRGRGHGYGLSQAGADSLAGEGWTYEEILPFFYKNIALISE